ncbi:unnamed protein product [Ilex paraguariensis]|uniref:Uncharacterized protein n=1 Tax=Ilex paraguariensis TaxID=185542 RepID=A0ABC8UQM0_9AQUA
MEDGVTEIESLLFPKNSSPREEKNHRQERDESKGGEEQRANGLIAYLISDLDSGRREEEENQREKASSVSDGKDEETVGGMINNLISNWVVFPSSPEVGESNKGKVDIVVVKEKEKIDSGGFKSENDVGGSGGGGGIISDLTGNAFH